MYFKLTAKTETGEAALRGLYKQKDNFLVRRLITVKEIAKEPYTLNFTTVHLKDVPEKNKTVKKMKHIRRILQSQFMKQFGADKNDYTVE